MLEPVSCDHGLQSLGNDNNNNNNNNNCCTYVCFRDVCKLFLQVGLKATE